VGEESTEAAMVNGLRGSELVPRVGLSMHSANIRYIQCTQCEDDCYCFTGFGHYDHTTRHSYKHTLRSYYSTFVQTHATIILLDIRTTHTLGLHLRRVCASKV
jgi:hypothetical protein